MARAVDVGSERSGMSAAECRNWSWFMGMEADINEDDGNQGSE